MNKKNRRQLRVRKAVKNTKRARLCVFRSNRFIYAQIIDQNTGKTLVGTSDLNLAKKLNKIERAQVVGKKIAELAKTKKIKEVVFDRGAYKYHGRIKALAESAREAGLVF